eukprot:2949788-Rhodomonas_salina.1
MDELEKAEILAIRLYTSSSYTLFNDPLRKGEKPHPLKLTLHFLDSVSCPRPQTPDPTPCTVDRTVCIIIRRCGHLTSERLTCIGLLETVKDPLPRSEQGLKKLRARNASNPVDFMHEIELWRGVKNRTLDETTFMQQGGAELAPMSTTRRKSVAMR